MYVYIYSAHIRSYKYVLSIYYKTVFIYCQTVVASCVQHAVGGVKFQNRLQAGLAGYSRVYICLSLLLESGLIASQRCETYMYAISRRNHKFHAVHYLNQERNFYVSDCLLYVYNCTLRDNKYTR